MPNLSSVSPFSNVIPADLLRGFVGREYELSQIRGAFENGVRGVAIVGPAGAGKTTLSRFFADQAQNKFPGGVSVVSASWAENSKHLLDRAQIQPSQQPSLLIIDDAEALGEDGINGVEDALRRHPDLKIILTSRQPLRLSEEFRVIPLGGLSRDEFHALLMLRNAIVHGQLDETLVEQLFQITRGNPALASISTEAVRSGAVGTWPELFQYLHDFRTPGLIGPDGRPLTRESVEYKRIVVDVSSTNSQIMELLKKDSRLAWELPSRKFEEIIAEILDKQGYQVSLTPASGDGGFDIYAAKKDGFGQFLYLVECKRYVPPNKVGVEIVRSLYGVLQAKKATAGAIVTTSYFTAGAEAFQRELQYQLHLHDYISLQKWIKDFPVSRHADAA